MFLYRDLKQTGKMFFLLVMSCCVIIVLGEELCCPDVGCFNDDYPFDDMPLPDCLDQINPDMTMYTRQNPQDGLLVSPTVIPWTFNPNKRTVFLTHGYTQGSWVNWIHEMKDAYLQVFDYNVVIVGWFDGALELWYPKAAANTQVVGREIGNVARNLVESGGTTAGNIWCVGHSLGSHVCGHFGTWYKIGRITGLDPAGPWFDSKDWSVGLNPGCADYVDAIHTHGTADIILGLGTLKPLGHVDIYPNGGRDQPGCILDPRDHTRVDLTPACSHLRVLDYWTEAVLADVTGCHFYSTFACYDPYNIPGACIDMGETVQELGPAAETYPSTGYFYMTTRSEAPFCRN